ncbi:MAG: hypothetical protein AAGG81_08365 [Chlamydiota bacterium]
MEWFGGAIASGSIIFLLIDWGWHEVVKQDSLVKEKIRYSDWIKVIPTAKKTIRIQSTFSYLFQCDEENLRKENNWSETKINEQKKDWLDFLHSIRNLLKDKPVRIEILLLDPFSQIADHRDDERGGVVKPNLFHNLRGLYENLYNEESKYWVGDIEVMVYNRLPGLQFHQIDSEISVSFFPPKEAASEQSRLTTNDGTKSADFYLNWFNETWLDKLKTKTLGDYMKLNLRVIIEGEKFQELECLYIESHKYPKAIIISVTEVQNELIKKTIESVQNDRFHSVKFECKWSREHKTFVEPTPYRRDDSQFTVYEDMFKEKYGLDNFTQLVYLKNQAASKQ